MDYKYFEFFYPSAIKETNNKIPVIEPNDIIIKRNQRKLNYFLILTVLYGMHLKEILMSQKLMNKNQIMRQKIHAENKKLEIKEKNKDELLSLNKNTTNNKSLENIDNIRKENDSALKVVKKKENLVKETGKKRGSYFLQIASVSDIKLVPVEWKRLSRIYPELAEKYEIKKINLKNGDTYYRILLGSFDSKRVSKIL